MMKRANSGDLVDRISTLPDSILSLILSFNPTKDAVASSVLSKRWKSLWKAVHNLDFNLNLCRPGCYNRCSCWECSRRQTVNEDMKFSQFVNQVLLLNEGGFLNKFSLVWKPTCIPYHVFSWISDAIARNVHELFLCVNHFGEPFEIPSSVFCCDTLKSLTLDGNIFVSDSIVVCLPRLERLILVSVYFKADKTFQKLISGCPMLNSLFVRMDMSIMAEYIQAYRDMETNLHTFVISSTSLRRFMLDVCFVHLYQYIAALPYCSLELEAPSLENLHVEGFVPKIFVRGSLSSLVEADFSMKISGQQISDATICNSLVEATRACDSAKTLVLSKYVFSALSRATIGLSTKFKRLTKLKIAADCCCCSSIQDFIRSSDGLEVLIVNKDSRCLDYHNDQDYYNDQHDDYNHTHLNWTTLVEILRCLSNSLKTVECDDYGGFDYEREMIRYMLMHGSVLEVMKINCRIKRYDVKLQLLEEICDFPRKSPDCRVRSVW